MENEKTNRRKEKRIAKKEARAMRKQKKKELRREVRERKKDVFRAKSPLGKLFWVLGRVVCAVFLVAVIVTVVEVNYSKVLDFIASKAVENATSTAWMEKVDQKEVDKIMPVDKEGAAAIEALPKHDKDETWAIYLYMVGSDLEANTTKQMSEAAMFYAGLEAQEIQQKDVEEQRTMLTGFMKDIQSNGMDLPEFFYEKAVVDAADETVSAVTGELAPRDTHAASADLDEIDQVTLPENVKMVIQAGGAGNWKNSRINPNRTQRFLKDSQGIRLVSDEYISNMGHPDTLADFLRYCREEHPADHTMVLFWNHGSGAFGYGYDSLYGSDHLTLAEMREAFGKVYQPDEKKPPIDIIGFDACLMGSMEVSNTFNGFASYLTGSEDTEPGYGWDYTTWLGKLAEDPQMNAAQLCKAATDSYLEFYSKYAVAKEETASELFSVIDLQYADDLYAAYDALAAAALKDTAENPATVAALGQAANRSIKYAGAHHATQNTLDLGMFMDEIMEYYPKEAKAVRKLVDKAVIYNLASDSVSESQGITVYYPSSIRDLIGTKKCIDYVDNISLSKNISALYYYKVAGCLRSDMQEYVQSQGYGEIKPLDTTALKEMENAEIKVLEDGNYVAQIDEKALSNAQTVGYNLVQIKDGSARSLGRSSFVLETEEGDLQTAYDGTWLFIDGEPFALEMLSYTDDVLFFISDITLKSSMAEKGANLLISYDFEKEKWSILGAQEKNDTDEQQDIASKNTTELKSGDKITPVYETYDLETGQASVEPGETIEYDGNIKIEERSLKKGEYLSYISITDARGDTYELPAVSFSIRNGRIQDAKLDERGFIQ